MPRFFLPRHARTHLPSGSDPIPGAVTSGGFPNIIEIPFWHIHAIADFDYTGFGTVTVDNTNFKNYYREATTDTSYIRFLINLGPMGANWRFYVLYNKGTDFGKVDLSWQTPPPFVDSGITYPELPDNTASSGSWYVQSGSGVVPTLDGYTAVPVVNQNAYMGEFVIGGAPGDLHTGWGAEHPNVVSKLSTGGPGIWRAELKINGKHASSAGYRARIQAFLAIRTDIDQVP